MYPPKPLPFGANNAENETRAVLLLCRTDALSPLQIVYNMQNIFNLLPNLNVDELVRSMLVKTNDMHLVIYVSALIRSVVALHDLVNNKVSILSVSFERQ